MKKTIILTLALLALVGCSQRSSGDLRLVYWNIQNGMWDGQDDNYDRFVNWVSAQKPDVCVWCEAQPIYKPGTAEKLDNISEWRADSLLLSFWKETAARYGHKYIFLGGHRDNYPQVITANRPVEGVDRIIGNGADSVVSHGAGWARIEVEGQKVNIVTLHTWPQAYSMNVAGHSKEEIQASKDAHEGDLYRAQEMQYICEHTIKTSAEPENEYWMMMGDFNSRSRVDNWVYRYEDGDPRLLVHDYILSKTPYIDIIHERYPDDFRTSTGGRARIDYVYCTNALSDKVVFAEIHTDDYTRPVRDAKKISNFYHPSDHRPIIVDFSF